MKTLIVSILGVLGLGIAGISGFFSPLDQDVEPYKLGEVVSDFTLSTFDGKSISLSDYSGSKGYIIVFTCNTCPYAKLYEDRIMTLANKYSDAGFPLLAINSNDPALKPGDSEDEMAKRSNEKKYTFPYLVDTEGVHAQFGATKTPQVYVLDGDKKLQYIGAIDDNPQSEDGVEIRYVEDAISAIQSGSSPGTKETRAIGCTIKPRT
ncbi:thioredoxin family protein [Membranihabitans maritimus]|uniref:thioredoxin family protein n=1 Tax=Membranihabitans maritimus TaxID=2904244 RepID=UPI001F354314|nr:thioredoxin family protein [Membranihabitans maritimus]